MSTEYLSGFLQWLEKSLATETLVTAPDQQLLERFLAARDEKAFRVLISRHGPMVYRVCRRVLPDEQDTEDAFQAAFLVLVRKAGSIRKRKSLASWLHGVAYQVALRARTSSQRRRVREAWVGGRDEAVAADDRSWREVRAILDEELARLPERLRAPLVLCYLEGLTQDEAAEQLGQTKRTLRRYLERGRTLLGTRLTQRGLALSGALTTTLFSECVVAMPPGLAAATAALGEAVRTGKSTALSHTHTTLTDEVIKTMFPNPLNLKWLAVALLGVGFGTAALGSLFSESQSREVPVALKSDEKSVPVKKATELVPKETQERFEKTEAATRMRGIDFLKRKQTKEGNWEEVTIGALTDMEGGVTALVTLALLEAGVSAKDVAIRKAVDYLVKLPPKKTYVVGLQTRVLARVDAKKHEEQIQTNVDWLLENALKKDNKLQGWSYPTNTIADGSNTHFAVMGLHVAAEAGAKVDKKVWKQIQDIYINTQKNGGWSYTSIANEQPSRSMTVCALVGLLIASKHDKGAQVPDSAFEKGLKVLVLPVPWEYEGATSTAYAMVAVAELGRIYGSNEFKVGNKTWEWYRMGTETLIKSQAEQGNFEIGRRNGVDANPILSTASGLYFLGPPAKMP
jgi:RNA polymerase sigma factor (sigma-70 family)